MIKANGSANSLHALRSTIILYLNFAFQESRAFKPQRERLD